MAASPNIVLVHGAWADGSCWSNVIERLQAEGYRVTAPQLPETSLAGDVARVRHVLTRQGGPTVLAAHSYEARSSPLLAPTHRRRRPRLHRGLRARRGRVDRRAAAAGSSDPGRGECRYRLGGLRVDPRGRLPRSLRPRRRPGHGEVMYAVQQPLHLSTFDDVMGVPAWRSLPSWYLVAENDEVIPPDAERQVRGVDGRQHD